MEEEIKKALAAAKGDYAEIRVHRARASGITFAGKELEDIGEHTGVGGCARVLHKGGWGFAYGASKGAFHRMAGMLKVELGERGIRAYNVEPGLIVHESQIALMGEDNDLVRHYRGAPVAVMAAAVNWLVTSPEAVALNGQTIFAQRLCKERQLVPGWPPPRNT